MRRRALSAAVVALAALSTWWWWAPRPPRPAASTPAASSALARRDAAGAPADHRSVVGEALRAAGASAPRAWAPPASLEGTEPDGAFAADANGNLIVSPELRRAFEYWFAASGEESDDRITARIAAQIRARLDDPAEAAALALLARFVAYRQRGRELAATDGDADLEVRAAALHDLRREIFGADADRLFADEEALVAFALAERRVAMDPALSDAEKAQKLETLLADAPAPIRAARAASTAPMELARDEAVLRAQGGSADDVQRLREDRVGAEAAQRLAAMDADRAAWRQRIADYRAERATIDADPSLDDAGRATAVTALRGRYFSGPELLRIDALDRIEME